MRYIPEIQCILELASTDPVPIKALGIYTKTPIGSVIPNFGVPTTDKVAVIAVCVLRDTSFCVAALTASGWLG